MVLHTQKNHLITQKTPLAGNFLKVCCVKRTNKGHKGSSQMVAFAIHALGMAIKMK